MSTGLVVNQKRIYGVMKAADLLVRPNLKLRARRKADTKKPRPTCPNQWWGIDNPKGNADTERFLRTLKEELVWLHEWTSPAVLFDALERWIAGYNQGYLHSTLGYRSPEAFEAEHLSRATPLPAAC